MEKTSAHREVLAVKTARGNAERALDLATKVAPLVPVAMLAGHVGSGIAKKVMLAANKGRAYKAMLQENPALQRANSEDSMKYFNTLYRMNPELAQDPVVAASFVGNQIAISNPSAPHTGMYEAAMRMQGARSGGSPPIGPMVMNAVSGIAGMKPPAEQYPFSFEEHKAMMADENRRKDFEGLKDYLSARQAYHKGTNLGR